MKTPLVLEMEAWQDSDPAVAFIFHVLAVNPGMITDVPALRRTMQQQDIRVSERRLHDIIEQMERFIARVKQEDVDSITPDQETAFANMVELADREPAIRAWLEFITEQPVEMDSVTADALMRICKQRNVPLEAQHAEYLMHLLSATGFTRRIE